MADVSKLNVSGTSYNIKDASARSDVETISNHLSEVDQAITDTNASYNGNTETITFTYGVI